MRIHGDKIIKRRSGIEPCADYHKYLPELQKDFYNICGYCGKSETVTKNAFEIDHFVPKKYDMSKENDYNNLVYSCYVCNRKKASKWPSEDPNKSVVDGKGIVDPATDEYDEHLERNTDGNIYGKTEVGKYMEEEVFQFHLRPIKEVWQLMQIVEKKKILREKIDGLSQKEVQDYIEMDKLLEKLQSLLFKVKE